MAALTNLLSSVSKTAKRVVLNPFRRAVFETVYHGWLPLSYYDDANWGDALSPVLARLLSGRRVKKILWQHQRRYLAIGSILGSASRYAEVWGSGFLSADEQIYEPPKAVHAVRGPRSRAKLLKQKIDCPEIYGDPALLFAKFYDPIVTRRFAAGIIPHYVDKDSPWLDRYRRDPHVRIIDVQGGIESFVQQVKSCDVILSSSLHGLICADAYGVPNIWVELSSHLFGGRFKFVDYLESVHRETTTPVIPAPTTPLRQITSHFRYQTPKIDLRPLVNACPFIAPEIRRKLTMSLGENARG